VSTFDRKASSVAGESSVRFVAIESLRRYPDLPLSDPVRVAAMWEADARDRLREARWNDLHGNVAAAEAFRSSAATSLRMARAILEAAAGK
jgi:hypothetical protein